MRLLLVAVALLAGFFASAAHAQNTFTVTASGVTNYLINGVPDPPLTVIRGQTYTFNVSAIGHPFYIKTVQGPTTANAYTDGVTGNGATSGPLVWVVPPSAPSNLFYNCSTHGAMTNTITVIDPVPATKPVGLALLALLVLGSGAWILRRRTA